ncbi:hypothetical protein [Burkholderia gladioli]|uniref:hypothetical protein n=1 Tax=Burkholderia gladioli TaxID=28095 RepID=UPI0015E4747D|nr:hypothetical protein [Burkholderia gladioli]
MRSIGKTRGTSATRFGVDRRSSFGRPRMAAGTAGDARLDIPRGAVHRAYLAAEASRFRRHSVELRMAASRPLAPGYRKTYRKIYIVRAFVKENIEGRMHEKSPCTGSCMGCLLDRVARLSGG